MSEGRLERHACAAFSSHPVRETPPLPSEMLKRSRDCQGLGGSFRRSHPSCTGAVN